MILMPVTSRLRTPPGFGEAVVTLWREARLLVPGAVKPILLTLDSTLVLRRLGRLEPVDRTALEAILRGIVPLNDAASSPPVDRPRRVEWRMET